MSAGQLILILMVLAGWAISSEITRRNALRSEAFNTLNLIEKDIILLVNYAIDSWSKEGELDFSSENFINSQLARIEINVQFLKKYLKKLDIQRHLVPFRGSLTFDLQYNEQQIREKTIEISSDGDKIINEIRKCFASRYL